VRPGYRWVLILLLLAGCGQRHSAPAPAGATASASPKATAETRAQHLLAECATVRRVVGSRDIGGEAIRWRACFRGDELQLLEERASSGTEHSRESRYYFDGGALFYFAGERAAVPAGGATGPESIAPVIIEFRGAQVIRAVRLEHYGEVRLAPDEPAQIRRRAAELVSAARDQHGVEATR
jgi:hypothetical protein